MQAFVARQPILDRRGRLFAYELLFRSGPRNTFSALDGQQATGKVISDSLSLFGGREFTRGRRAFINFPQEMLVKGYPRLLPKDWVAVEVLETVEPTPEVLESLAALKAEGYYLVLDDFAYHPRFQALLELADLVKVDLLAQDENALKDLVARLKPYGMALLAEKVETPQQFRLCQELGFSYFQGYFFSRPEVVAGRELPPQKLAQLQLLREINLPELSIGDLERIIKQDLSLSYKLLSYINSAGFGLLQKVTSIRQAMTLLGQQNLRLWASLLVLGGLAADKPDELIVSSILRARFCESLARHVKLPSQSSDYFLLGLFSQIDAIMDRPLAEAIAPLPLVEDIRAALLGQHVPLRLVLETALAYERGDWEGLALAAPVLGLNQEVLPALYAEALAWAQNALKA
jgi:EAL and modified HD-GYP domain-containing signal transduction protein